MSFWHIYIINVFYVWRDLYASLIYKNILTVDSNLKSFSLHMQTFVYESYEPRLC